MTSPSPGIVSPSSTTTMSPLRSSDEPTSSSVPSARRRWAVVSERVLAQRGRLGPAARLGDGLGVRREQDREPQPDRDLDLEAEAGRPVTGWSPVTLAIAMSVTRTAVISTTNMTGFLISRRGSSLRNACGMRGPEELGIEDAAGPRRLAATAWRRRGSRSAGSGACRGRGRRTANE